MMRALLALMMLFSVPRSASPEMIFVNLNDAQKEIDHCKMGLEQKAAETGVLEPLEVFDGVKGNTPDANGNTHSNTYWALRKRIKQMLAEGRRIDSIVISGEDGSGHFFGTNKAGESTNFYAADLRQLYNDFPQLNQTLNSAALWGCYPTSVHGAEKFWVNRIPAMQFTMGFTIQGPNKEREANHDLMRQFCHRREEAAQATTQDALCDFYKSLQQLTTTSLGLCNRTGIASDTYAYKDEIIGMTAPGAQDNRCFTYENLKERCSDFVTNYDALQETYDQYRQGKREDLEFNANGGLSDLRLLYNQVQLWRHCADQFKTERGYDLPYAPDIVRLVKFKHVTANIMKKSGPEMAQYDAMLTNMGLGAYRLGDISKLSRGEIVAKIEAVVMAMEQLAGGANSVTVVPPLEVKAAEPAPKPAEPANDDGFLFGGTEETATPVAAAPAKVAPLPATAVTQSGGMINGIETARALRMAQCLRMALVNTDYRCVPFSYVGDNPDGKAVCVMGYERAAQRFEDDPC